MELRTGKYNSNVTTKKLTKEEPRICKNCAYCSNMCINESSRYFKDQVSPDFTCEEIEIIKW